MFLRYSTPEQVAQHFCLPWNPSDPLEPLYDKAALQFNTDNDPSLAAMIKVDLQNQILSYNKVQCTDCATEGLPPTQTVINPPASQDGSAPAGFVETNTTNEEILSGVGIVQQGISQVGGFVKAGTAFARALPIIGDVVSVIGDIVGIFSRHHQQAVAEEQAVNCGVANAFNKWIPQYDYAVYSGQLSAEAALQSITQIIQGQLLPALRNVTSAHNWGWGAGQRLQAHLWFRQQWYPMLESGQGTGGILSGSKGKGLLIFLALLAGFMFTRPRKTSD